jgi:hypothetical protein
LERDAARIVADVERNLGAVEARAHAQTSIGSSLILAALAVIALAIVLRLGATPTSGGPSPNPSAAGLPSATPGVSAGQSFGPIAGTYTVTLNPADSSVSQYNLGGDWTMRLDADGAMSLFPPTTFGSGTSSLSGIAFSLTGDQFRSNLFYNDYCSSIGTYTWSIQAGQLSFTVVAETCAIRRAVLATVPWRSSP